MQEGQREEKRAKCEKQARKRYTPLKQAKKKRYLRRADFAHLERRSASACGAVFEGNITRRNLSRQALTPPRSRGCSHSCGSSLRLHHLAGPSKHGIWRGVD